MTRLRLQLMAARELGPASLVHLGRFRLGMLTGLTRRRTPIDTAERPPLLRWLRPGIPQEAEAYAAFREREDAPRFLFDRSFNPGRFDPSATQTEADEILEGRFRLFGRAAIPLGLPPDWFAFPPPLHELDRFDHRSHWSQVPLDAPGRDVRLLWELSRFGWLFPLAVAYRQSKDEAYADAGWTLIDAWRRDNPANRGVHWASAQEAGLRIVGMSFALHAFAPAWEKTPDRVAWIGDMVASHAARIPPTVAYAQAQGNNHLLSEAAGLLTAGLLFPEFRAARAWERQGRALLEQGFRNQIFDDGGYVQYSVNYQRMALELGLWAVVLAERNRRPLSAAVRTRLGALARNLCSQVDPGSGRAPAFGPDDGTRLLRLGTADPHDLRPVLEAGARAFLGVSWFPGAASEGLCPWLGLDSRPPEEPPQAGSLPDQGIHYLRGESNRGSLRSVRFRSRPGHSDQLHVDLWRGAEPLSLDPGSYLYNGPPPWTNSLSGSLVHNTPVLDGEEPMARAGTFLWVGRSVGGVVVRKRGPVEVLQAYHDGYRRLGASVSRTLARIGDSTWVIQDGVSGEGPHRMTVGWNLPDGPWNWSAGSLGVETSGGPLRIEWRGEGLRAGLAREGAWAAGDHLPGPIELWGWRSPGYGALEASLRLVLEARGEGVIRLATCFHFDPSRPSLLDPWWEPATLELWLEGGQAAG